MDQDKKQWDDPFNSFNSWKVLFHADKIKKIQEWRENDSYSLPSPVSVTIDPTNRCNHNCVWCLYKGWKEKNIVNIPTQKFIDLIKFLKTWGVKSVCLAGGGEPFMHEGTSRMIETAGELGLDVGTITNGGILLDSLTIDSIVRWNKFIGFSMDAGTPKTHARLHKTDEQSFENALANMKAIRNFIDHHNSKCRIGYKYLLTPWNCSGVEINYAMVEANENGAHDLHFRVAYMDYSVGRALKFNEDLKYAFERINNLKQNWPNLKIYGISHKYNQDYLTIPRKNFKECWLSSLALYFGADGNMWLCADTRGWEGKCLGNWIDGDITNNVFNIWGKLEHRKILENICVAQCPRCTFSFYNELYEQVVMEDNMTRNLI